MLIGKIVGTVVATRKDEQLEGMRFQVVEEVNIDGKPTGSSIIAIDAVGAGIGEIILYATGSSARQTVLTKDRPVDAVIMAIVDHLEIGGDLIYVKN